MQTYSSAPPRIGKTTGLIQSAMPAKRRGNRNQPRCKKSGKYICKKKQ
jgi:hypothetical protein